MVWDGGLGLPMPQVPGGLGSAEAMTQMAPPVQRMAQVRVKKIFGVPVPERRARTFLGGLAGMPQITPGGGIGNFFAGLQGGLRGSLQAGDVFDQRQAEAEQAQVDNAYKQAMIDKMNAPPPPPELADYQKRINDLVAIGYSREEATKRILGVMPENEEEDLGFVSPDAMGPLTPSQIRAPEGLPRAGWKTYAETLGRKMADPDGGGPGDPDEGLVLSEEALDNAALAYAKTGQLPAMGMGKAGARVRAAILNRAGAKYPGLDIVGNKADTDSRRTSLTNVTKIYDASSAWEETATRNADVMLEALKGIPDIGNRPMNKVLRGAASMLGDPKVAAFNTARETIKVEFARLLSSPGVGNAVLSDAARREIEGILAGDYTKPQMINALKVLKRDAKNRKAAYKAQIDQIRDQVRWGQWGESEYQGGGGAGVAGAADSDPEGLRGYLGR